MNDVSESPPKYLTRKQLAGRWAVTVRAIIAWEKSGHLRAVRFGSLVRYAVSDVEAAEQSGVAART